MPVEMADAFRADGKIWVVITVIGIILVGLFATSAGWICGSAKQKILKNR